MSSHEKTILNSLCSLALLSFAPFSALAAGPALTDLQCDQYSDHYGDGSVAPELVKTCCDSIFSNANASVKQSLVVGTQMFVAAARGKMICVDRFDVPASNSASPTFVSRGLITGSKTGLRGVTSLNFGPQSGMILNRPALVAVDSDGNTEQVLVFNYLYDGNVPADRMMRPSGLTQDVASIVDTGRSELILLGQDGKVRTLGLESTDLSLNPADHSRITAEIDPVGNFGAPIAMTYGSKLDHVFVLTDTGQVLLLNRSQPGHLPPESVLSVTDVVQPTSLALSELLNQPQTLTVSGSSGSSESFVLSTPASGTSP